MVHTSGSQFFLSRGPMNVTLKDRGTLKCNFKNPGLEKLLHSWPLWGAEDHGREPQMYTQQEIYNSFSISQYFLELDELHSDALAHIRKKQGVRIKSAIRLHSHN